MQTLNTEPAVKQWQLPIPLMTELINSQFVLIVLGMCFILENTGGKSHMQTLAVHINPVFMTL